MRTEHINEFMVLAKTLNYTSAAKELRISQPALSSHIMKLEEEIGASLFHRSHQRVHLTNEGAIFMKFAEVVLAQQEAVIKAIAQSKNTLPTNLSVGYLFYAYRDCLPEVVAKFGNTYPGVNLQIKSYEYSPLSRALSKGEIDLALTIDVDASLRENCQVHKLMKDPICCVVRFDDPIAALPSVSLADLDHEALILPHPEYSAALASYYEGFLQKAGVTPNASILYGDIDTRSIDVHAGTGVALIGRHFEKAVHNHDLRFIPINEDYCSYDFVALWKRTNRNPTIVDFLEMLSSAFGAAV